MNFWFWVLFVAVILNVAALVMEVRRYRKAKAIRKADAKLAQRIARESELEDDEALCKAIEERWGAKAPAVIRAARHHGVPFSELTTKREEEFKRHISEALGRFTDALNTSVDLVEAMVNEKEKGGSK